MSLHSVSIIVTGMYVCNTHSYMSMCGLNKMAYIEMLSHQRVEIFYQIFIRLEELDDVAFFEEVYD